MLSREPRKSIVTPPPLRVGGKEGAQGVAVPSFREAAREDTGLLSRYQMRSVSQELSGASAVRLCGRVAAGHQGATGTVTLEARQDGTLGFTGLLRCNSVWECPVCAPRLMQARAEQLRELFTRHQEAGGSVLMVTLTGPHDYGDDLESMRRHVANAWRKVITGAPWSRWRKRHHVIGFVRSLEVTHGANGWHPHLHILVYFAGKKPPAGELVRRWFFNRWALAFTRGTAWRFPSRENGCVVTVPKEGDYLAKMGLSSELTLSHKKRGRARNRSPWQILADLASKGEERDEVLWREWSSGMRGARQLTFSRELRRRYSEADQMALDLPAPDVEEAAGVEVAWWSAREWVEIARADSCGRWRVAALGLWRYPRHLWRTLLASWEADLLGKRRPLPPPDAEQTGPPAQIDAFALVG